jgi:hypothetical protein
MRALIALAVLLQVALFTAVGCQESGRQASMYHGGSPAAARQR